MPRSLTANDFRQIDAVFVLIGAQRRLDIRGLDEQDLHDMLPRYLREAEKRGVTLPPFYPNIVTDRYPEIYQAIVYAMSYDYVTPRLSSSRLQVNTDFSRWLEVTEHLTRDEVRLLREAAGIAVEKFPTRDLDDDLPAKEEDTETASS